MRIFAILLLALSAVQSEETAPKLETPSGTVKGYYKTSYNGRIYEAYEGIPYAAPPIGELRFQPPQSLDPWPGILVAHKAGPSCLQYSHLPHIPNEKVEGSEDCLYLNIYAPKQDRAIKKLLPVIFWIHGGAFQFGDGISYGPKYLLDRDVVLVTINYRLGPLGFLSTEDNVVQGNMGLKDQNLALRWVYNNIESFGGNAKEITLTGNSAGGASVHYHYLSPLSKGLFQRGLSLSGTAFNCWTQIEASLEKAKKLADHIGCPVTNTQEMIQCLRKRPAHQIVAAVGLFQPWLYNPYSPFGPVVEKGGENPFIDSSPIDIIHSGKVYDVPWIIGVTQAEGLYPAADFVANEELLKELNDNWDILAPHLLDYNFTASENANVANAIRQHYLGSKAMDQSTVDQIVQLVGDRLFVVDAEKAARMQAEANRSPVWFYYFNYRGAHSLSKMLSHSDANFGVSHADDLGYVLDSIIIDPTTTAEDKEMQKKLIEFWVTFAETGKPNLGLDWPRLDPSQKDLTYLHIAGPQKLSIDHHSNLGEKEFWNTIHFHENKLHKHLKEEL